MARQVVILDRSDCNDILTKTAIVKLELREMRKTTKRDRIINMIDEIENLLTDDDLLEKRVERLETMVG